MHIKQRSDKFYFSYSTSASEMTHIVSSGALNFTHSLTLILYLLKLLHFGHQILTYFNVNS